MFYLLHDKISSNRIFESTGRKPQRPVKYQLATFLIRYGLLGSDTLDTALKLNIGHGTVFLYCRRVTRAIRELKSSYIGFPSLGDLQESSRIIQDRIGFPRCCGSGDGSLIRFDEKPLINGTQFMGRKHFFGVRYQFLLLSSLLLMYSSLRLLYKLLSTIAHGLHPMRLDGLPQ